MTRCVVIVSDSGGFGAIRDAANGDASETHTMGSVARVSATRRLRPDLATIHTDVPFPTYRGGFPPASRAGLATADGVTLGKIGETVNGRPNTSTHFAYDDEALERTFGTARYSDSGFVDVNQTAHPSSYPPATVRT